jgi:hypothetical protein
MDAVGTLMLAGSTSLPGNAGYVAAAYLVFLALILVYVGIMAYKLISVGRAVAELDALADPAQEASAAPSGRQRSQA